METRRRQLHRRVAIIYGNSPSHIDVYSCAIPPYNTNSREDGREADVHVYGRWPAAAISTSRQTQVPNEGGASGRLSPRLKYIYDSRAKSATSRGSALCSKGGLVRAYPERRNATLEENNSDSREYLTATTDSARGGTLPRGPSRQHSCN